MSDLLRPHGLQHPRLPCSLPILGACWNLCLSCRWCHPTISSSGIPFSSRLQSFPASGSFPMSQLFTSGDQCWSFSFSISPSNEYSGLISFRMDWLDLLAPLLGKGRLKLLFSIDWLPRNAKLITSDWKEIIPTGSKSLNENLRNIYCIYTSLVAQLVKNPHAMQETLIWSLDQGRSPGEEKGYQLEYSCLGNPMYRWAWQATLVLDRT